MLREPLLHVLLIAAVLFVLVALAAAAVVAVEKPWARVAVRVVGSRVAAIGVLTIGWSLR